MHSKPPDGFQELGSVAEKQLDSEFCAMGVVADFLPPSKSSGTDHMITFTLTDPSWSTGEGLKCRFFGRTEEKIPPISSIGDVVVLRSFRLKRFKGDLLAISHLKSSWLVFHQQGIPANDTEIKGDLQVSKMSDQVPSPGKEMVDYALQICNFLDRSTFGKPTSSTALQASNVLSLVGDQVPPPPTKYQMIQDLVPPRNGRIVKFADLLGEVRKIYKNDWRVELTITDYTSHEALYDYAHASDGEQGRDGDPHGYIAGHSGWAGPWGKMSLVVTVWDSHANFAREHVGFGNLVFLRNVQIGFDREGSKMEGKLRGDRYHPEKIGISICKPQQAQDDDRIKSLMKRKRDYEVTLKLHGIKGLENSQRLKEEVLQQPAKKQELTAAEKKKQKKKEREKEKKAKKKEAQRANPTASKSTSNTLNPNIRTNKVPNTVTPLKISEILDPTSLHASHPTPAGNPFTLPFKNNLYHLKPIRVIDFHPPHIADFAAPHKQSDYEYLSDYSSADSDSDVDMLSDLHGADVTWEWRFQLLVEDASIVNSTLSAKQDRDRYNRGRMKLLIAGPDADFLLRNVPATNLREDAQRLGMLKEKLFLLWGDLQERKEEGAEREGKGEEEATWGEMKPSGRPFECLVKEYGVQAKGGEWERVFAMFGTSIVSD
jgi:protection of telomeres protein 1